MYFLFKMVIFHCYVSLPEGTFFSVSFSIEFSCFFQNQVGLSGSFRSIFPQHLACVCQKLANPNKKWINYITFPSVGAAVLLYILPPPLKAWWFPIFFMFHPKNWGKWIQFWLFEHIFLSWVGSFSKKPPNSKSTARTLIPGKGMGTISSCCNANDVNLESEQRESKMQKDRSKTPKNPTVRPGNNLRMGKKNKKGMHSIHDHTRWWFRIFFISIYTWGRCPIWLIFFKWVETTK